MSCKLFKNCILLTVLFFTCICTLLIFTGTGLLLASTHKTNAQSHEPESGIFSLQYIAQNTSTDRKNKNNSPSLKLLSPNGGEVWTEGNTYSIRWVSNGVQHIRIAVAVGGKDRGHIGEGETIDAQKGSYAWKIPSGFITGFGALKAENVRLMIYDADRSSLFDLSDAAFSITAAKPSEADANTQESDEEYTNAIVRYYNAIAEGRYRIAYELLGQGKIVLYSADGSAVSYGPRQDFDTWVAAQKSIKNISVIDMKRLHQKKGPNTYSADMGNAEAVMGIRTYKVMLDVELSGENWTIRSGRNSFFIALVKGDDRKIRILGIGTGP